MVQELKSQPGWVATVTLADRETARVVTAGYWESEEALRASEPGHQARMQRGQAMGSRVRDLERYEIVLLERTAPPQENTFVRLVDLRGTPAKLDETTAFVGEQVLPLLKKQKGFRALLMGVNRETGRSLVGSVWDSAADREASDATLTELRRQGAQIAGAEPKVELYGVVALFEKSEGALAGSR
jgi:heme-degrading monooxygenase HmoA